MCAVAGVPKPKPERLRKRRIVSHKRLAVADALSGFGLVTFAAGIVGVRDDLADAVVVTCIGTLALAVGVFGRSHFARRQNLTPGRILAGLAWVWSVLVLLGALVYLATATTTSPVTALFESAAGFGTTALSDLDPVELTTSMQLFRAGTQWLGGAIGLLAAVVSLPLVLSSSIYIPTSQGRRADRLVPSLLVGRRRVLALYFSLTIACGVGYGITGMTALDATVHAATTLSTGGFSSHRDSLASYGAGVQLVAIIFMTLAGASYFVIWWALRGRPRRVAQSTELWLYLGLIVATTSAVFFTVDSVGLRDAMFQAASAVSTTGFAVTDWTLFPAAALTVLLIATATGAMGASAGGGLKIARAAALATYARLELRRHLDPNAVLLVRRGGRTLAEDEIERLTGYQIAHFGMCAIGAFLLTITGVDVVSALWSAISVLSTAGPSLLTGPFGDAGEFNRSARLLLIPGMLAGRLTILPLLAAVVAVLRWRNLAVVRLKRIVRDGTN